MEKAAGWVLCGEWNGTQSMAILLYGGGDEGAGDMKDEGTGTVRVEQGRKEHLF